MNKTLDQARDYAARLRWAARLGGWSGVQPFIVPPATALHAVALELGSESSVLLGAQNAHWADAGAWTGEVSMRQVRDAGAQLVELGHSERRAHFGESDRTVNLKVHAALRHGLRPLVCVGEPAEVFQSGQSVDFVLAQVLAALDGIPDCRQVLIAYEPVWAIGEHGRPAEPADVAPVFTALAERYGGQVTGLLYGGSVNQENMAELIAVDGNDGLFVGRAAWDVEDFLAILDAAAT